MALNSIQLWSPDTCGCVIHTAYDDTLPPSERVLSYVTEEEAEVIVHARRKAGEKNINPKRQPPAILCPAHAAIGAKPELLATVRDENNRKNIAFSLAQEIIPELPVENYRWSFDKDRNLKARFIGVNQGQLGQIQAALSSRFGVDKASASM